MPDIISCIGPNHLLKMKTAAVLNSRQSKYPTGGDSWVRATVEAVDYISRSGMALLTSVGMHTWELPLALAAERHVPVMIVISKDSENERTLADNLIRGFRLDPDRSGFLFLKIGTRRDPKAAWPVRDEMILRNADCVIPVSIRPYGNLECLIENHPHIIRDYGVTYDTAERSRPRYDWHRINPAVYERDMVIHFTRSTASPWPDETDFDYYHAVVRSGGEYCRSAARTLRHILDTGVIFGSRKHIRGGYRAVGFTKIADDSCMNLFRYRPRLVNPYFEPFGIGIHREIAERVGIKPVIYGPADLYDRLADEDKPYYQNSGTDGARWKSEHEWRYIGDMSLPRIPKDAVRIVVPLPADARWFAPIRELSVECLFENMAAQGK